MCTLSGVHSRCSPHASSSQGAFTVGTEGAFHGELCDAPLALPRSLRPSLPPSLPHFLAPSRPASLAPCIHQSSHINASLPLLRVEGGACHPSTLPTPPHLQIPKARREGQGAHLRLDLGDGKALLLVPVQNVKEPLIHLRHQWTGWRGQAVRGEAMEGVRGEE